MSIRTVIVGILAAFSGVCATVGVMMSGNSRPANVVKAAAPSHQLYVAKIDIDMGQKIIKNQLSPIEWHSDDLPANAVRKPDEAIDQFAIDFIAAGEVLTTKKISESATTLLPAMGMRAFAIASGSAAASVGQNLVPGNRVDILWQSSGRGLHSRMPNTVRLLQNVKILAIGQVSADVNKRSYKSITFELKPRMDENLSFAANTGTLQLSLRNPEDHEGVEPREITNLKSLMEDLRREDFKLDEFKRQNQLLTEDKKSLQSAQQTLQTEVVDLKQENDELNQKITVLEEAANMEEPKTGDFLDRIPAGMRALTIATPSESAGMAGLLEPTNRVDLQLTITRIRTNEGYMTEPSETMIENLEVLAVGTRVFTVEGEAQKRSSRTVTLAVFPDMIPQIKSAQTLGKLTLNLRGTHDNQGGDPLITMTVKEFSRKHMFVSNTLAGPNIHALRGGNRSNIPTRWTGPDGSPK